MRRAAVLVAAAVLAAAAVAADAQSPGFRHGVAAGDLTSTSAILWTRAPRPGPIELELSTSPSPIASIDPVYCCARKGDDLTFSVSVRLRPNTRYWYRFKQGALTSPTGTLKTPPRAAVDANVRFAISGDADATPDRDGKPAYSFRVYARMAAERNDFNINLGDTIYSDSGVGGAAVARTVEEKWGKYKLALAQPESRRLRAAAGLYSHWDDHEFVNDFSRAEHGSALYRAGVEAFRDYSPVRYGANGLFRTVRWGRNLELFFLDERSFRSAKATAACNGDFAPTAPQPVRDAFGSLAPSLRNPVPPGCLAAIDDPSRTMLGRRQYTAFTKAIAASTATWKVVVNEVPIQQFYALPYDRWEGYAEERMRLLRFLRGNVKNVVFVTTDMHASAVNEVRVRTLGGPPEGTGIWEVVTGPVATNTYSTSVDRLLGVSGGGTAVASLFFKPQPPNGIGMRCAALDVPSYAQVTVRSRTLTIASRDARGRLVREKTGRPCAPLVLAAR
jgi:phosphodiesterase/alkaline phosphatase D-like protein